MTGIREGKEGDVLGSIEEKKETVHDRIVTGIR
jgi:hypothetical protein